MRAIWAIAGLLAATGAASAETDAEFCRGIAAYRQLSFRDCMAMMAVSRANERQAIIESAAPIVTLPNHEQPIISAPMPNLIQPQVRCRTVPTGFGSYQTVCQ